MAARYGAGQYEDAFRPPRLQNWSVTRPGRQDPILYIHLPLPQRPLPREGSTPIIANDRGHLLPTVPRSQASPWGAFVGTWDMPTRIPPARLDLTARSAAAAARLVDWIHQPTTLSRACNGLRTEITGKPQKPRLDTRTAKEPSQRSSRASSKGVQPAGTPTAAPLEVLPGPGAGATALPPREPSCMERWLKADGSPESPESPAACRPGSQQAQHGAQTPRSHRRAVTDLRHQDAGSPKIPASVHSTPREASPRQATPLQVSTPSRGVLRRPSPEGADPRGSAHRLVQDQEAGPGGSAAGARAARPHHAGL